MSTTVRRHNSVVLHQSFVVSIEPDLLESVYSSDRQTDEHRAQCTLPYVKGVAYNVTYYLVM